MGQRFPWGGTVCSSPHLGQAPLATDHCKPVPKSERVNQIGGITQSHGRGYWGIQIRAIAITKVVIVPQETPPKMRMGVVYSGVVSGEGGGILSVTVLLFNFAN